jgi:hypothetical protein
MGLLPKRTRCASVVRDFSKAECLPKTKADELETAAPGRRNGHLQGGV